jgi:carbon-monoxide dehydrogenase large subunit
MTLMLGGLSAIIGHPVDRIRLHARDVGGGFGIRSDVYAEYCAAMLAAKTLGKPVKWVGTRSESFVSDHHGRAGRFGRRQARGAPSARKSRRRDGRPAPRRDRG